MSDGDPPSQIPADDDDLGPSDGSSSFAVNQSSFLPEDLVLPTYQEATMEETSSETRSSGGVRTVTIFLDQSDTKSHDFGLTLRTTPEGVVIVAVAPNSAGDRANLKAGALLLEVNGLTLVGASAEEAQVVLNECSFAPKTMMLVLDRPTTRSVSVDEHSTGIWQPQASDRPPSVPSTKPVEAVLLPPAEDLPEPHSLGDSTPPPSLPRSLASPPPSIRSETPLQSTPPEQESPPISDPTTPQPQHSALTFQFEEAGPSHVPITPQLPQVVELFKKEQGLGFSIIGGGAAGVFVYRLDPSGLGAAQGKLNVGDRILAINGVSLQRAPLKTASALLRGVPNGSVLLLVLPHQLNLDEDFSGAPLMSADYHTPHTIVVNANVQVAQGAKVVTRSPLQPSNINISIEPAANSYMPVPSKSLFSPKLSDRTFQESETSQSTAEDDSSAGAVSTMVVRLDLDSKFGFKSGMTLSEGMQKDEDTPGPVVIDSVADRSPAARAGICKGDSILALNGENVMNLGLYVVLQRLYKSMSEEGHARLLLQPFIPTIDDRSKPRVFRWKPRRGFGDRAHSCFVHRVTLRDVRALGSGLELQQCELLGYPAIGIRNILQGAARRCPFLQVGQVILAVGPLSLFGLSVNAAIACLANAPDVVELIVANRDSHDISRLSGSVPLSVPRTVRLPLNPESGLGLILSGGKEAHCNIFVNYLVGGGVADKEGHLRPGDIILSLGGISLTNVNYETAITALMRASHSPRPLVDITYMAGAHSETHCAGRNRKVQIRQDFEPLGLGLVLRSHIPDADNSLELSVRVHKGIFIHSLEQGGVVANDGRMRPGDQIIEVDGTPCTEGDFEMLRVYLAKPAQNHTFSIREATYILPETLSFANDPSNPIKRAVRHLTAARTSEPRTVTLERREGESFGLRIADRLDLAFEVPGLFVDGVVPGSRAEFSNAFQRGDMILSVNGSNVVGLSYLEAMKLMEQVGATLVVTLKHIDDDEVDAAIINESEESRILSPGLLKTVSSRSSFGRRQSASSIASTGNTRYADPPSATLELADERVGSGKPPQSMPAKNTEQGSTESFAISETGPHFDLPPPPASHDSVSSGSGRATPPDQSSFAIKLTDKYFPILASPQQPMSSTPVASSFSQLAHNSSSSSLTAMADQASQSSHQTTVPRSALSRRNSLREILDIIDSLKSSQWKVVDIPVSFSPDHGIFNGWKHGGGVGTAQKVIFVQSVQESKRNEFLDPAEFLLPGDVLLMVGHRCLLHANVTEASDIMRTIPSPASMLVARRTFPPGAARIDFSKPEYFSDVSQRFLFFSIRKTADRLGFHISGGSDTKLPHVLVKTIADNSVVAPYLRAGDRLVVSNGIRLLNIAHQQAVEALKSANTIELLIERVPPPPLESDKGNQQMVSSSVEPESGSFKTNTAQATSNEGEEHILRAAKVSVQERPHSAPVEASPIPLMQSFMAEASVLNAPPPFEEPSATLRPQSDNVEPDSNAGLTATQKAMLNPRAKQFDVAIQKIERSLGLFIHVDAMGRAAIHGIAPFSSVSKDGRLRKDDILLQINKIDLTKSAQPAAMAIALLQQAPLNSFISFLVLRLPDDSAELGQESEAKKEASAPSTKKKSKSKEPVKDDLGAIDVANMNVERPFHPADLVPVDLSSFVAPEASPHAFRRTESTASSVSSELHENFFTITFTRDSPTQGLGLSIVYDTISTHVIVKKVLPDGVVGRAGGIQVHDHLLNINGTSLVGTSLQFAIETLKSATSPIVMQCLRHS